MSREAIEFRILNAALQADVERLTQEKYEAAKRWEAESEDIQSERDALQLACYKAEADVERLTKERDAAERRVEELREALKVFALSATLRDITREHLRRARAAYKGERPLALDETPPIRETSGPVYKGEGNG